MYIRNKPYKPRYLHNEPVFLSRPSAREEAQWKDSVYYWWWRYLRASKSYERCCKLGGKRGVGRKIYKDFGDVFASEFRTWWHENKRGESLFAEQPAPLHLAELDDATQWDAGWTKDHVMVIAVPLFESRRRLQSKFAKLLQHRHEGQVGVPSKDRSRAVRKIYGKFNLLALKTTLEVYELRQANAEMTLADICEALLISPIHKRSIDDTKKIAFDKRNAMTAAVGRYLAKAKALIYHAERGDFPRFDVDDV